jgi:SAM-dependent methyltransferase
MQQHTYAIMDRVEDSHWWFVGRRAILEGFLQRIAHEFRNPQSAIRILDVGCGTGANLEMLSQFGKAEGVDVSDDALEFCRRKGLTVQKGLAETLPYADETFDITTALDVVEHLDDDIAGLKECSASQNAAATRLSSSRVHVAVGSAGRRFEPPYPLHEITDRRTPEQAGYAIERATYANWTFFTTDPRRPDADASDGDQTGIGEQR